MKIRAVVVLSALILVAAPGASFAKDQAPEETPEAVMTRVYELLEAERLDDADALLRRISGHDPLGRRARMERAYLELRRRRWHDAVALLGSLLDEDRADARLRMELGYARLALGDRSAAADEFSLAAREPGEYQERARAEVAALAGGRGLKRRRRASTRCSTTATRSFGVERARPRGKSFRRRCSWTRERRKSRSSSGT